MKSKCQLHEDLFFPETEAAWRAQSSDIMNSLLLDDLQNGPIEIHVLKLSYPPWQHSGVGIFRKDISVEPEILAHTEHPHLLVLDLTDNTCVKNTCLPCIMCQSTVPQNHTTQHSTKLPPPLLPINYIFFCIICAIFYKLNFKPQCFNQLKLIVLIIYKLLRIQYSAIEKQTNKSTL